jgi:cardiolipin synthase
LGTDSLPAGFWIPLQSAGGEVREFNPIEFRRFPIRNHRKVVVIDEQHAGVGGFNVADEYTGDGETQGWADTGLAITGPVARVLAAEFDRTWISAEEPKRWFARLRRGQRPPAIIVSPELELLLNGPGRSLSAFQYRLREDLRTAGRIEIASAYFLPTLRQRQSLRLAARRGAVVRVIVPGLSDVGISQRAARHLYAGLLRAGVEIYEYQPQVFHAKMILADGAVYVGSSNLDTRSLHINYEVTLRVTQPQVVAEGRALFEHFRERSRPITLPAWLASRNLYQRWRDALAYWLLARVDPYMTRWVAAGPR